MKMIVNEFNNNLNFLYKPSMHPCKSTHMNLASSFLKLAGIFLELTSSFPELARVFRAHDIDYFNIFLTMYKN